MPYFILGDHKLHYETLPGAMRDAPSLVLLHHGLGSVELWYDMPERLNRATGCPVFTFSRRGYGKSDPCPAWPRPWDYMLQEAADALPAILEAAGLEDVILVGHSDGATIALANAGMRTDPTHSPRLRGVAAIAPHLFVEDVCITAITAMQRAFETTDLKQRMARYHDDVEGAFYGWAASWLQEDFRRFSTDHLLGSLKVPVIGIQGLQDEYGTMAQLDALEAGAGGPVETVRLDGCGHMAHRDQPEKVAEIVARFVSGLV